jgi:hypothetical protein
VLCGVNELLRTKLLLRAGSDILRHCLCRQPSMSSQYHSFVQSVSRDSAAFVQNDRMYLARLHVRGQTNLWRTTKSET